MILVRRKVTLRSGDNKTEINFLLIAQKLEENIYKRCESVSWRIATWVGAYVVKKKMMKKIKKETKYLKEEVEAHRRRRRRLAG